MALSNSVGTDVFQLTESERYALSRAILFQFSSFEGSYSRVVNRDIVYAANLVERCTVLARLYEKLNNGFQIFIQSDSLRNLIYHGES